jgi:hypothetical protein
VCNNDDPHFPINSNLLQNIGGNVGALAVPVGYRSAFEAMVTEGLVTLERVQIIKYRA